MQRSSLKARILDHTELRLWEQGYRGMRVDELARDVGISKRTLYEQFRTKEEMAREALARRLDRLQHDVRAIVESDADPCRQVRSIVKLICEFHSKARPPFYRDLETTPSLTELVRSSREHNDAALEGVIREGAEAGQFRREIDPRMVRQVLLFSVETIVRPGRFGHQELSMDQAFEATVDLILNGLRVCASRT